MYLTNYKINNEKYKRVKNVKTGTLKIQGTETNAVQKIHKESTWIIGCFKHKRTQTKLETIKIRQK